ncbi:deleted in malignant brain tumors 1 protein-like [Polypterus senegalus]|uniref:deleted in malignant brain tumors 1 protein-like n=1 Tax=Polypterus senegalus TaxID=55291 RepID=UPI001964C00B|nr:deleted in malignant brain tumors 1 protein-like [Polypterus senegalus]
MAAMFSLLLVGLMASLSTAADPNTPLRLVNGGNSCSGKVEVFHQGQWGSVSHYGWDLNDAKVVCRQLGCGRAISAPGIAHFGGGSGKIWMDDVACTGKESSLMLCQHSGLGKHNCDSHEDAGVVCSNVNGQLRLVKGTNSCSGRVEVFYQGQWGTVCDDSWDLNDAKVVCRQVGCGNAISAPGSAHFGRGSGKIWMDDVACTGNESSLMLCQHRGLGKHDCSSHEDAGVICSDTKTLPRLVNGTNSCSGRVEVFYQGQWGTVCDDSWDLNDAKVVCRQLGCGNAIAAPGSAHFGRGSGKIWMDDVACIGNESSLTLCKHRGLGEHNCGSHEDAGVVCSDMFFSQGSCENGWVTHSGRCYKFFTGKKSWIDAELHCLSLGGNLASVLNSSANKFITSLIKSRDVTSPVTWLGGSDAVRESTWLWTDGSRWNYSNWNSGDPNNAGGNEKCIHINFKVQGGWNDKDCTELYPFVCVKKLN